MIACGLLVIAACGEDSVDVEPVTATVRPSVTAEAPPIGEPVSQPTSDVSTTAALAEAPTTSTLTTPVTTTTAIAPDVTVGPSDSATGVVVEVDGDLRGIDRFSVLSADGATLTFIPEAGLLFDRDGPLSHLRDHLLSGNPVLVEFYEQEDSLIAVSVGDAE